MQRPLEQSQPTFGAMLVSATWLSLQPLVLNLLSVPVLAYIIHRLGADGYGQWMAAATLLGVCGILTNLGLRGTFVRSVAADPASAATALAEQLGLRLLLSMVAVATAVSVCGMLGYAGAVLWCTLVGGAGLILLTLATTLGDLLQALQRIRTVAAINFATGLILTAVSFMAVRWSADPVTIAVAYLSGPLVGIVLLAAVVRRQCGPIRLRIDVRRFGTLLGRGRFLAAQQFLAVGSMQAESLLLPRLVGMSQFGFFTAGSMIATRLTVLPDGLCTAAYAAMVRAFGQGRRQGGVLVARCLLVGASGGIVVAVLGTAAAASVGALLLPADPTLFATVVRITIWSLPLVAIEMVMSYGLNAAGEDAAQVRVSMPAAVLSLCASVMLVICFGVPGACWSMLLRPAIRIAFLAPVLKRACDPRGLSTTTLLEARATIEPISFRKAG